MVTITHAETKWAYKVLDSLTCLSSLCIFCQQKNRRKKKVFHMNTVKGVEATTLSQTHTHTPTADLKLDFLRHPDTIPKAILHLKWIIGY